MLKYCLPLVCMLILQLSCNVDPPKEQVANGTQGPLGTAARLTDAQYAALTAQQQYQVANKLLASFFKGVSPKDFFKLSVGTQTLQVDQGVNFIRDTEAAIKKKIDNPPAYLAAVDIKFSFDEDRRATAEPIAIIREYPLSRNGFEAWMAYVLANTIMFSPAEEIDSADYIDVQRIYAKLVKRFATGDSIRDIVYKHMLSQENWRRFRSPEDNTREMMEIYLGLFDRDEDVPSASIACKNWYLTGENDGYQLIIGLDENIEPQRVLDQWVTNCFEFYRVVADHPLVIPRVTTVLVNHFLIESSSATRAAMVQSIVATNPQTFHEVFTHIIFSKEYLLNTERPKSFEETFFNIADRIGWIPNDRFYRDLTNPSSNSSFPTLHQMKQPSMSLKLGRFAQQPLDSLSFAFYHQAVRERLLLDMKTNNFSASDAGWSGLLQEDASYLLAEDFLHYVFLAVVGRKAAQLEIDQLTQLFLDRGYEDDKLGQTMVSLDYLSRLSELYYMQKVTE